MKKSRISKPSGKLNAICLCLLTVALTSCEPEVLPPSNGCGSTKGILQFENTSSNTLQRVRLGNTNMGTVEPGEEKEWYVTPGDYVFSVDALNNNNGGCQDANIHITECNTTPRSCSY